jgi:hypothetical protein
LHSSDMIVRAASTIGRACFVDRDFVSGRF